MVINIFMQSSIMSLASFLNLKDRSEDYFKLIVGWLLDALYPGGPYMMLVLNGPPWSDPAFHPRSGSEGPAFPQGDE